jgi:hypothetical protein
VVNLDRRTLVSLNRREVVNFIGVCSQLVTVEPVGNRPLQKGDIVLCKVNGSQYLHLIKAIQGDRYQIGNNIGRINGWIGIGAIYGICTDISS